MRKKCPPLRAQKPLVRNPHGTVFRDSGVSHLVTLAATSPSDPYIGIWLSLPQDRRTESQEGKPLPPPSQAFARGERNLLPHLLRPRRSHGCVAENCLLQLQATVPT